ncbi:acyl dehydratase [Bacillus cereus]|nr:acyl dehydratase [Bacillus cereus]
MFFNIKEMSRALSFDSIVTNNDLFGRQAPYFIEKFYLEKVTKGEQDTFFQRVLKKTYNLINMFLF